MASFMLALIGLKKFRSFQEPNRKDVLEKKTRRVGAGPGVEGSVAESREAAVFLFGFSGAILDPALHPWASKLHHTSLQRAWPEPTRDSDAGTKTLK